MKHYKHDEVIRAWLDGKRIQRKIDGIWHDVFSFEDAVDVPRFSIHDEIRVAPNKVRVACMETDKRQRYFWVVESEGEERSCQDHNPDFKYWITDWIDS